jgi:Domain of unknown function DUF29
MKKTMTTTRPKVSNGSQATSLHDLYELDEVAWLEESSSLIREGRTQQLDFAHLAEYLEDMARSQRREVKNRLATLLAHLLKWQFQPRKRSRGWSATIVLQRGELEGAVDIKTLRNHAALALPDAYRLAVKAAVRETGLKKTAFPEECPYSLEFILGDEFPGGDIVE